jgi:hypothetical protein
MIRAIYKYRIAGFRALPFELPLGPDDQIQFVGLQRGVPHLWAEVRLESNGCRVPAVRRFHIIGTGSPIPPNAEHVGTWIDGDFVWHLFERMP